MNDSLDQRSRHIRLSVSLIVLAVVAAGLYGFTLWRFGGFIGGGP